MIDYFNGIKVILFDDLGFFVFSIGKENQGLSVRTFIVDVS